ncbi:unnamed protein product, partial [Adineta ricciae]
ENAGGRRVKSSATTFNQNPAYLLTLSGASAVRIILQQLFEADTPLAEHYPIGIYIVSKTFGEDPAFVRARSVSRLVNLKSEEEYYIVPACFEPNSFAKFAVDVLCDTPFTLDSMERKLPIALQFENKVSTPPSTTRKPVTTTTTTRRAQHRRSRSLSEVWLEHRPQGTVPTAQNFSRRIRQKHNSCGLLIQLSFKLTQSEMLDPHRLP